MLCFNKSNSYFLSVIMNVIQVLSKLSDKERAAVMNMIENSSDDLTPIEIDYTIYQIPKKVADLINNLVDQISDISTMCSGGIAN